MKTQSWQLISEQQIVHEDGETFPRSDALHRIIEVTDNRHLETGFQIFLYDSRNNAPELCGGIRQTKVTEVEPNHFVAKGYGFSGNGIPLDNHSADLYFKNGKLIRFIYNKDNIHKEFINTEDNDIYNQVLESINRANSLLNKRRNDIVKIQNDFGEVWNIHIEELKSLCDKKSLLNQFVLGMLNPKYRIHWNHLVDQIDSINRLDEDTNNKLLQLNRTDDDLIDEYNLLITTPDKTQEDIENILGHLHKQEEIINQKEVLIKKLVKPSIMRKVLIEELRETFVEINEITNKPTK